MKSKQRLVSGQPMREWKLSFDSLPLKMGEDSWDFMIHKYFISGIEHAEHRDCTK